MMPSHVSRNSIGNLQNADALELLLSQFPLNHPWKKKLSGQNSFGDTQHLLLSNVEVVVMEVVIVADVFVVVDFVMVDVSDVVVTVTVVVYPSALVVVIVLVVKVVVLLLVLDVVNELVVVEGSDVNITNVLPDAPALISAMQASSSISTSSTKLPRKYTLSRKESEPTENTATAVILPMWVQTASSAGRYIFSLKVTFPQKSG